MPYCWTDEAHSGARIVDAWPHRSLPRRGFVAFLGVTWAMLMIPLAFALGSAALWVLLPFALMTLGLTWFFLERSYQSGRMLERLRLTQDVAELVRQEPGVAPRRWRANPYWVEIRMFPQGGPVENYLTLKGAGREVEFGACLSPAERAKLFGELQAAFGRLRNT